MLAMKWPYLGFHAMLMLMPIFLLYSRLCCAHGWCTNELYTLTVTVQQLTCDQPSEHRIHPGDTTHTTHHTHTHKVK